MNTKHTLGIIGFGGMGRAHFDCLQNFDRVQVKGVFDLDPAAQQVARDRGLISYESKEALLADPEIDMVLVSTTNEAHKPLLIEAMRAGKNVISEKPVTISSEELLDVMAVAEETGKVFTIDQNRRTNRDFVLIPLNQIAPNHIHPVYRTSIHEMMLNLPPRN